MDKFNPETMRKDIVRWVTEAKTHYSSRFKAVDEYVKRYEAKRSISGLMGWGDDAQANPKNSPWNNCYTPDTEILTKKGWISIKDITTSDLVYSMNPLTKESWWMPVTDTQVSYHEKMIHFKGKSIDLIVSPNHNMLVVNKNWLSCNVSFPHSDSLPAKFIKAEKLLNKKSCYSIPLISKFAHSKRITEIYGFKIEDWIQFLGWYISEGYTHKNSGTIGICQDEKVNPEKCQKIRNLLGRMNLKYSYDGKQFTVFVSKVTEHNKISIEARKELKNLGLCHEKYVPEKYLDLDSSLLNILLDTLIMGDGHIHKKGNGNTVRTYYTTSKKLVDNIQEIAQKIGLRASFNIRNTIGKSGIIRGEKITTRRKGYNIGINTKSTIQLSKLNIIDIQYDNLAYCCTTPFHTLYVRRNGKAVWCGNCSDIGIPIEAFTIEGLLPRFSKVCFGAKPVVWVRGTSDDDHAEAPIVQDALNFQLSKKIKIYRRMKPVYKNTIMHGDGFAKCVWEVEKKIINRTVYYIKNTVNGQYLVDEQGENVLVGKDTEIPPVDEQGFPQEKEKQILSDEKKVYDCPKVYSRNIKQVIIPKDAISPNVDEIDWICDTYERTIDWCKRNTGEIEEGKFDEFAVRELEEKILVKNPQDRSEGHGFTKILISEWHGKYDINDDGLDEEVVVFIGSANLNTNSSTKNEIEDSKLLGWMITPYPQRPFFHYQIIPMDNSFYGKGVPEFLIGIRNLVDAVFNQMIDRGSITNNPPVIVPAGHDPDENPYGPGAQWVSDNPSAYRVLDMPKSEQLEFTKMEFLLALVQKLFGVTDYSLGQESSIAKNRTATGIMTIVGEGNIKFDDMIRSLQDINEDLYDFIVQLNADLLDDEFVYAVTGAEVNPFRKITKKQWTGNFDFESVGNSININREIEQNRAILAYRTAMDSVGKNPVITPEVLRGLTENLFRSIDMRNIKIPTVEELQQMKIPETAQALKLLEQQKMEELRKGGQSGQGGAQTGQPQGQPSAGIPGMV